LGNPVRRAAYDREARAPGKALPAAPFVRPDSAEESGSTVGVRLAGLPLPIALVLAGLVCLAAVASVLKVMRAPPLRQETGTLRAPRPLPAKPGESPAVRQPEPAAAVMPGSPTHFIQPGNGQARLWRGDPAQRLTPGEMLEAATTVKALRLLPRNGLMQIELAEGGIGYVDAARLTPGDQAAAHKAFCAYSAGPPPANGEVLGRVGGGADPRLAGARLGLG